MTDAERHNLRRLYDVAHDALRERPTWDESGGMTWDDYIGDLAAYAVDAVLAEQRQVPGDEPTAPCG